MKRTILSLSLFFAATGSAIAGQAADDAKLHFQAIGAGDTALLARGYADNAQLNSAGADKSALHLVAQEVYRQLAPTDIEQRQGHERKSKP